MVACGTEGTVSVSTVMFRDGASVRDLMVDRDATEGLVLNAPGRWDEAVRCSCILPLSALRSPPSPPCPGVAVLRSSVTFDDVTSFRSSSVVVLEADVAAEGKL
jgi:hypothetical protein